ncbi:MAG: autotransporter outer membrane beta-barrel domain-containing protein, partial [Pseudomonadota bacterium]
NFEDTNGQSAIATNGSLAFVPDGAGGATAEPYDPATGIVSASGTTEADYINLALGTPSGCAVDLNFLRAGGIDAQAFTDVFTTLCVLTAATSSGGPTTLPLNQFRDIARVIAANHRGIVKQVIIVRGDSPAGQHFSSKMSDSGTKVTENAFGMEEMRLFGAFTGVTGEYDDTGNNVGIDYHGGGLLFGGDYTTETESGGTMRYALSLGYDEVQGDLEGSDSTSDSKGITIGGTASYFDPQGWYVLGDLQFGFHDFSNKREVGSSFASSDPKVRSFTTEVEAGYTYALEGPLQTITPFAGLGFGRYEVSDYEEDTGIEIDDFTTDVGYAIVGVRGNSTIPSDMGDYYAAFEVAGRINLFSDDETAEFVSGTGTAIVDGVEDDSLAVTLEVGYDVDEKSRLFARYSGNYSEVVQQHSLNLGYQYNF